MTEPAYPFVLVKLPSFKPIQEKRNLSINESAGRLRHQSRIEKCFVLYRDSLPGHDRLERFDKETCGRSLWVFPKQKYQLLILLPGHVDRSEEEVIPYSLLLPKWSDTWSRWKSSPTECLWADTIYIPALIDPGNRLVLHVLETRFGKLYAGRFLYWTRALRAVKLAARHQWSCKVDQCQSFHLPPRCAAKRLWIGWRSRREQQEIEISM